MSINSSTKLTAITPSDSAVDNWPAAERPRQVYVGGTGNIVVVNPDGTTATLTAVPVGAVLNISPARINATGTTATNLVALF